MPAGEAGVAVVGGVEVEPGEAAFGLGGKVVLSGKAKERFGQGKQSHGDLLVETPILADPRG